MARLKHQSLRASTRERQPLGAVDAALALASRRELVPTDEALTLLRNVQAAVEVAAPNPRICGIIADATVSYTGQMMLDRGRIVDPLLDIRLAISK